MNGKLKVCLTCGGSGFKEAFVFCDKCGLHVVHRYCMATFIFSGDVFWLCDDCEPIIPILLSSERLKITQVKRIPHSTFEWKRERKSTYSLRKSKRPRREDTHTTHIELRYFNNTDQDKRFGGQKWSEDSNTDEASESCESKKFVSVQLDVRVPELDYSEIGEKDWTCGRWTSGGSTHKVAKSLRTTDSQLDNCRQTRVGRSIEVAESLKSRDSREGNVEPQLLELNFGNSEKLTKFVKQACLGENSLQEVAEFDETKSYELTVRDIQTIDRGCCMEEKKHQRLVEEKGQGGMFSNEESGSSRTNGSLSGYQYIPKHRVYFLAQPVKDPIWWGRLNISSEASGTVCGLFAYLSSKACFKVMEAATSLPSFLSPELLHRSDVWPKGFRRWGPSDDSIALYFFPDSEWNNECFDGLVNDMICKDLAMKTVTETADLLIFTSRVLPLDYWRFQSKFYLWGVFRGKQPSHSASDVASTEVEHLDKALKKYCWESQ